MKRLFIFTMLLFQLVSAKAFSNDVPINVPPPHPIYQSISISIKLTSVQVSYPYSDLAINFESSTETLLQ